MKRSIVVTLLSLFMSLGLITASMAVQPDNFCNKNNTSHPLCTPGDQDPDDNPPEGPVGIVAGASVASSKGLGTLSLAEVLLTGQTGFDKNWNDFDIVTAAVLAVLADNPNSAVKVLTDGQTTLTAFLPTDRAFRKLVKDLTGKAPKTEKQTFDAVAGLGLKTVENVLLYHVIPGVRIDASAALQSNGATLQTALAGESIKVKVTPAPVIILRDGNKKLANPIVNLKKVNINGQDLQIAHGINRVLMPS